MDPELKEHITSQEAWIRGLFLLLFSFILAIAKVVGYAVVVLQFLFTVFSGQTNDNLQQFGASLCRFIYQVWTYLTYNSDDKPFPFNPWPSEETGAPAPQSAAEGTEAPGSNAIESDQGQGGKD